ncbi:hypothetical protein BCR35DRAFT_350888 [Leucosporidium creatinivorum]|uniref:Single hybrid motif-containing protein n=1 Tax=Leucosporidium creatinivorum TaxID=106004 RepID=A0A1Y2FXE1_9BASI|nr:hypothetical protein BCR35DRAFT_350888 [Leucosporidium creatinivorum]
MLSSLRLARSSRTLVRHLHASRSSAATSELLMPAMSPTMTEGTLQEWKFKVGDSFSAGDVLVSIETDKASIDVEAQDDGILGKILVDNGTSGVAVGKLIAVLAEEGDDLSAIEVPSQSSAPSPKKEESAPAEKASSSSPAPSPPKPTSSTSFSSPPSHSHHPTHPQPLLPSVLRLLVLNDVKDTSVIKATGFKGTLTKGDVLAHLGKISNPRGSEKEEPKHDAKPAAAKQVKEAPKKEMDGPTFRSLIAAGLRTPPAAPKPIIKDVPTPSVSGFDSILDQYLAPAARSTARAKAAAPPLPPPPRRILSTPSLACKNNQQPVVVCVIGGGG